MFMTAVTAMGAGGAAGGVGGEFQRGCLEAGQGLHQAQNRRGPLWVSTFFLWWLDWVVPRRQTIRRNWPRVYLQSLGQMWKSVFKRRQQHIYWTNLFQCNSCRISAWGKCWWKGHTGGYLSKLICMCVYPKVPVNQCFSRRQVEMQFIAFDAVILCICILICMYLFSYL